MEQEKQKYIRKIKLKLEQPNIMCSGRNKVECYYRGKVIRESQNLIWIIFKSKGKEVSLLYSKKNKKFLDSTDPHNGDWDDLKIIE